MGRIHRYGQLREVRIVNVISKDTREGRVLGVLLEKLDAIREELASDKVFDVIGRLFENRSLRDYMGSLLTGDDERDAVAAVTERASVDRVRQVRAKETAAYGAPGEVAARLPAMNSEVERERYLHLLPAHVRRFVEKSAPLLGLEARGDLDGFFSLAPGGRARLTHSCLRSTPYPPRTASACRYGGPAMALRASGSIPASPSLTRWPKQSGSGSAGMRREARSSPIRELSARTSFTWVSSPSKRRYRSARRTGTPLPAASCRSAPRNKH